MNELVSWPGLMSLAVVATVLVTSTVVLLLRRLRGPAASLTQVLQDVDHEPAAKPSADWKGKAVL
jgi:hypothetical protein